MLDEQAPQSLFLQQPRVLHRMAWRAGGALLGGSYTGWSCLATQHRKSEFVNCAAKRRFTPIPALNSSLLLGSSALAEVWLCSSPGLHFSLAFYIQEQARDRGGLSEEEGPKASLQCCHEPRESKVKPACPGLQRSMDGTAQRLLHYLAFYFIFNPTTSPWVYSERLEEWGQLDLCWLQPNLLTWVFLRTFEIPLAPPLAYIVEFYMAVT